MSQPLLAVNHLTHLYAPDKGFRDVSFELWPGEVLGIVGESGSGKTTLLKAISARLTPQRGEVLYQQRSLYAMSEAERRRLLRTEWGWCISTRWTACVARSPPGATSANG